MTHFVELKIDAVSQLHITDCLDSKLTRSLEVILERWQQKNINKENVKSLLLVYCDHNREHGGLDI